MVSVTSVLAHPVQQHQQLQIACEGKCSSIHKHAHECHVCCFITCSENPNEHWKDANNCKHSRKGCSMCQIVVSTNIGLLSVTRKVTIKLGYCSNTPDEHEEWKVKIKCYWSPLKCQKGVYKISLTVVLCKVPLFSSTLVAPLHIGCISLHI